MYHLIPKTFQMIIFFLFKTIVFIFFFDVIDILHRFLSLEEEGRNKPLKIRKLLKKVYPLDFVLDNINVRKIGVTQLPGFLQLVVTTLDI